MSALERGRAKLIGVFLVGVTIYHNLIAGENTQQASQAISWRQSEMPKGGKRCIVRQAGESQVR